ncbi:hypothetical protein FF1_012171 [Malus domestica]
MEILTACFWGLAEYVEGEAEKTFKTRLFFRVYCMANSLEKYMSLNFLATQSYIRLDEIIPSNHYMISFSVLNCIACVIYDHSSRILIEINSALNRNLPDQIRCIGISCNDQIVTAIHEIQYSSHVNRLSKTIDGIRKEDQGIVAVEAISLQGDFGIVGEFEIEQAAE